MFTAALTLSIVVILSLVLRGSQEIQSLVEERSQIPRRFWLYRSMSRVENLAFVVTLPVLATAVDFYTSVRTAYFNPTAALILNISAILGLSLPPYVYSHFREVVESMRSRIESRDDSRMSLAIMATFASAAGGSSTYQAVTAFVAFGAYMIFAALAFLVHGLFLFRLLPLLVSVVIAGIVAPMTTTVSGFVVYCAKVFGHEQSLDVTASDGQGGFKSLGTIGLLSSSMSAVVAGLGVPVSFFAPGTVTSYEYGLTLFTVFFVVLTFGTPVVCAHNIIASSKKNILNRLRDQYNCALPVLDMAQPESLPSDQVGLLRLIYLESIFERVLSISEWPSDYTLLGGVANAAIPILVDLLGRHFGLF
jgi:hypothetical protein